MKDIVTILKESNESTIKTKSIHDFKKHIKFQRKDWDEWIGQFYTGKIGKKIILGNDPNTGVLTIHLNDNKLEHIASWNPNTTVLYTDDLSLFEK